ncbi:hypothetical protein HMSSN139_15170 [Paenibacillus sp. HMSSN-139]|nr:hypothetical protein HMSSN139_15170 [Paenibacillus sp. HMSSN-139]
MKLMDRLILPAVPSLRQTDEARIRRDYERFRHTGLPARVEAYVMEEYGIDVSSNYGSAPIKNPFGKAAGQLSLNESQVLTDAQAGLGFVVLKTVIAENGQGHRSMEAWAVKDTRMKVEPIVGAETGDTGWNVTWHGRGWHGTFAEYLRFVAASLRLGREWGTVVVPLLQISFAGGGRRLRGRGISPYHAELGPGLAAGWSIGSASIGKKISARPWPDRTGRSSRKRSCGGTERCLS